MTDLQLRVMRLLWDHGNLTAAEIRAALRPQHRLAVTTVSTLLGRMARRGDIRMERSGRQFHYAANISEADLHTRKLGEVADLLFSGNAAAAIATFLDQSDLDPAELKALKQRIAQKEAALRKEPK